MSDGFSIDVGSALPYVVDRVLGVFGKDSATTEWKLELTRMVRLSHEQASHVQCVGMSRPIPIEKIYQRTYLTRRLEGQYEEQTIPFEDLLKQKGSSLFHVGSRVKSSLPAMR